MDYGIKIRDFSRELSVTDILSHRNAIRYTDALPDKKGKPVDSRNGLHLPERQDVTRRYGDT